MEYNLYVDGGGTAEVPCYFSYRLQPNVKSNVGDIVRIDRFLLRNLSPTLLPINCVTTSFDGDETSNIAEYCALYYSLERFAKQVGKEKVIVYQDSQLIVNQVKGNWNCKKVHLLYWLEAIQNMWWASIDLKWVPREKIFKILGH